MLDPGLSVAQRPDEGGSFSVQLVRSPTTDTSSGRPTVPLLLTNFSLPGAKPAQIRYQLQEETLRGSANLPQVGSTVIRISQASCVDTRQVQDYRAASLSRSPPLHRSGPALAESEIERQRQREMGRGGKRGRAGKRERKRERERESERERERERKQNGGR